MGRIVVGAALISVLAGVLWLDGHLEQSRRPALRTGRVLVALPLAVLTAVLIVLAYLELARLTRSAGMPIARGAGVLCAVAIGLLPFWRQALEVGSSCGEALPQVALGGILLLLFAEQVVRHRTAGAVRNIAGSLLAVCYLGVCSAVILGIRIQFGMRALILFLTVVKATDIGAYFTGTFLGRHRLVPSISAGKTWEGLGGGLALATGCALAVGAGLMAWWNAIVFALLLGLFGQAADLCESVLKRDAGLKDSGSAVPHFGGLLDVVDSPLLSAPAGYVLLALFRA